MRRSLSSFALAAAITVAVAACATTTSPTGRTQYVGAVSQQQLNQMGEQAFAQMRQQLPQTQNAQQRNYVTCVTNAVIRELPQQWQQLRWETAVFQDNNPNAFALPGGKVGVYTGIFSVARDQNQLAAVIAHEIGHVIARHHDERITRQMGAQVAVGVAGAAAGQQYGQMVSQGGSILAQTGFLLPGSRAQETEADVVGQDLMARAGFDPRGAITLWQNMISASQNRPPQWLSTHPNPEARIGELRARAEQLVPVYEQARAAGKRPSCG